MQKKKREETDSYKRAVTTSVMPKGVEHAENSLKEKEELAVTTSVMPKGVEHMNVVVYLKQRYPGDYLCDAERR